MGSWYPQGIDCSCGRCPGPPEQILEDLLGEIQAVGITGINDVAELKRLLEVIRGP